MKHHGTEHITKVMHLMVAGFGLQETWSYRGETTLGRPLPSLKVNG